MSDADEWFSRCCRCGAEDAPVNGCALCPDCAVSAAAEAEEDALLGWPDDSDETPMEAAYRNMGDDE